MLRSKMNAQAQQVRDRSIAFGRYRLAHIAVADLALASLFVLVAAIHLVTLTHTPTAFVDEAWGANRGWALLHTGRAFGSLDAGVFNRYDGYWTYFPWLAAAVYSVSTFIFGPTLLAVRLVSFASGLVLLLSVYMIANRLYNRRAGAI